MSNSKNVAWSTEMTESLSATYTGDNTQLEAIAQEFNKSVPMIRSKLVSMKLYQANTKVRKVGGDTAVRKIAQVRSVETILSLQQTNSIAITCIVYANSHAYTIGDTEAFDGNTNINFIN